MNKQITLALILLTVIIAGGSCTKQPPEQHATIATPTPNVSEEPSPQATPTPMVDLAEYLAPAAMDLEAPPQTPRYSLGDAQARGLIHYEMTGVDDSLSMILKVERLTDTDIDVYIVPGTVFQPGGSDVQRMAAWKVVGMITSEDSPEPLRTVTSMYLPTTTPRSYMVTAFCLDFELANPSSENTFQALAQPHVRAAQIMYAGNIQNLSTSTIQSAIWIDEDHVTRQQIQSHYDASDKEIDDAFELLKDLPYPQSRK